MDHLSANDQQWPQGPYATLLSRLRQVAWDWHGRHGFVDQAGRQCALLSEAPQILFKRLMTAWQQKIAGQLSLRHSFEGVLQKDPLLTMEKFARHGPAQSALLRAALNGTYYTASHAVLMRKTDDPACPWCGKDDTPQHRPPGR